MAQGSPRPRARQWSTVIAVLVLLGVGLYIYQSRTVEGRTQTSPSGRASGRGGRGNATVVPVSVAAATTGDMGEYITALGTVTALRTVVVHTRVDGELIRVNFKEGQLVHEGDLLAIIDQRPLQVQLTQAQGQLAKDQATLQNAQLDLK